MSRLRLAGMALGLIALLCWVVMFLAGTDVWHFAGRPDFWRLSGAPYADLRVFGYAFYVQLLFLLGVIAVGVWSLVRVRRSDKGAI